MSHEMFFSTQISSQHHIEKAGPRRVAKKKLNRTTSFFRICAHSQQESYHKYCITTASLKWICFAQAINLESEVNESFVVAVAASRLVPLPPLLSLKLPLPLPLPPLPLPFPLGGLPCWGPWSTGWKDRWQHVSTIPQHLLWKKWMMHMRERERARKKNTG